MLRSLIVPTLAMTTLVVGLQTRLATADDCDDAADQAAMTACAERSFKNSDRQLNSLYREIERRLSDDPDTKQLLVKAQRAWIAFRDAECGFSSSDAAGGTVYPMVEAMCLDGVTKHRIEDFNAYLNCEEGDLGCPVPASD